MTNALEENYQKFVFNRAGLPPDLIRPTRAPIIRKIYEIYKAVMRGGGDIRPIQYMIPEESETSLNNYEWATARVIIEEIVRCIVNNKENQSGLYRDQLFKSMVTELTDTFFKLTEENKVILKNTSLFGISKAPIEKYFGKYGKLSPYVKKAYTHNGIFHADDACFAALLKLIYPGIEIVRVPCVPKNADLAFDIGFGVFDHHQSDARTRPDGIKYSSFGLLWDAIGHMLFDDVDAVRRFDAGFVHEIDYVDNYGGANPFSATIRAFNPNWDSFSSGNSEFIEAVEYAKQSLQQQFDKMEANSRARAFVQGCIDNPDNRPTKNSVILDVYAPYDRVCLVNKIKYVIYPSNRNYMYYNVGVVDDRNDIQRLFPKEWLKAKPIGCTFIMSDQKFAVFATKDAAIDVVKELDK